MNWYFLMNNQLVPWVFLFLLTSKIKKTNTLSRKPKKTQKTSIFSRITNYNNFSTWKHLFCFRRLFFPTCQVRVVRFYQSCSPPPPPPPPSPPPPPPPVSPRPCLHQLPPPLPPCQLFAKLFANFPAQCALLDLNLGPSQLSAHRWTSTWDLPSSVRTAGPQPGTFRAQCAPLDLNLGPSQLSAHRYGQIECQKICQIECPKICQIKCHKICQIECQKICQIEC